MAGLIAQYQQGAFTTPINGTQSDASIVLSNDNNVRTKHNSHDGDATIHVQSSVLASRPAAGTAQRVWITTDGLRAYIDDGASWDELAYLPLVGGTLTGGLSGTTATFSGAIRNDALVDGFVLGGVGGVRRLTWDGTGFQFINSADANCPITISILNATDGTFSGSVQIGNTSPLAFGSNGSLRASSDGVLCVRNQAANSFDRLQLGGTTSSFPSIKRSAAALHVRLADDSDYASLTAGDVLATIALRCDADATLGGSLFVGTGTAPFGVDGWKLGPVAAVSPTSPNRTLRVSVGGTSYYIHAKTTND